MTQHKTYGFNSTHNSNQNQSLKLIEQQLQEKTHFCENMTEGPPPAAFDAEMDIPPMDPEMQNVDISPNNMDAEISDVLFFFKKKCIPVLLFSFFLHANSYLSVVTMLD